MEQQGGLSDACLERRNMYEAEPRQMSEESSLRKQVDEINLRILDLLSKRGTLVEKIGQLHAKLGEQSYQPDREQEMLAYLVNANEGPFSDATIERLFKEIFRASLHLKEQREKESLRVSRKRHKQDTVIEIRGVQIGAEPVIMAGPCAIESLEQLDRIACEVSALGVRVLRGGAFKPRTSPYAFQGLGQKGLEYLRQVASRYDLITISEVLDTRDVELVSQYADILQIGSRNMQNFSLLTDAGKSGRPVVLKRGFSCTITGCPCNSIKTFTPCPIR